MNKPITAIKTYRCWAYRHGYAEGTGRDVTITLRSYGSPKAADVIEDGAREAAEQYAAEWFSDGESPKDLDVAVREDDGVYTYCVEPSYSVEYYALGRKKITEEAPK